MRAQANGDGDPVRDMLLADLWRRQPLLAAINVGTSLLFVSGLANTASSPTLAAWFACVVISQSARLMCGHYVATRPREAATWLVAASASSGLGWGATGILFSGLGSPTQQMLVPFFLSGMAAGSVVSLGAHLPAFYAFLTPALLPYAAHLVMRTEPAAHTMAITIAAYAAGLAIVAYQVHHSIRRLIQLHLENMRLVADLQQARRGLQESLQRRGAELDAVMQTVPVAVWLTHDHDTRRITGNRRAFELLRLETDSEHSAMAWGRLPQVCVLKDGEEVPIKQLPLQRAASGEAVHGEELRIVFYDDTVLDMLISAVPVRDGSGAITGAVAAGVDITDRKRTEERIRHLAHHDSLTGLPNRALLQNGLRQALALAHRDGSRVGLLLVDLDHFKDINDTLGHPAGDRLLCLVAHRLRAAVRPGDTLARLGGDEFVVVQPGLKGQDSAAALARRLVATLGEPFMLESQEVHVSASIGVAIHPDHSGDADELVREADLALYQAKQDGRGRFRFFRPAFDVEVRARRKLEKELRAALERGEFALHYQPQLDLRTQRVTSLEVLVRWQHPDHGLVLPGEFIPAAEASGLIRPIGEWVFGEACRQVRAWRDTGVETVVAVNLSPAQLRHESVLREIDEAMWAGSIDPRWLELEITESLLLEVSEGVTARTLSGLASRGIRLVLDDFGTGYSSLTALKRLPVSKIKIDRSFVRDIGRDPDDEAVVRAIVSLGHALGKQVVAEGVENEMQLEFLQHLGCDAAQGFLFGPPQMPTGVEPLLAV